MKKLAIFLALFFGVFVLAATTYAGKEKVDICHIDGKGAFRLITIGLPAYEAHMAHGDKPMYEILEAGPIWNQEMANETCPDICIDEGGWWTGSWSTTVPGEMSVCVCQYCD